MTPRCPGFVRATTLDVESRRYKMHEIPFSKMIQPRISTTWAYNGKDTVYASYAQVQPGRGSLPARRIVGPQPGDDDPGLLRRQRRAVRDRPEHLVVRQAVRRRPDAADARRVAGGHARSSSAAS